MKTVIIIVIISYLEGTVAESAEAAEAAETFAVLVTNNFAVRLFVFNKLLIK